MSRSVVASIPQSLINYACWSRDRVTEILAVEAEGLAREAFLAVTSSHELRRVGPTPPHLPSGSMAPESILRAFLDPNETHVAMACIGDQGTGKSHFIQWLKYRVVSDDHRTVVVVPRTKVSLREVLELLLRELPVLEREKYEQRLAGSRDQAQSDAARRTRMAREIGHALQFLNPEFGDGEHDDDSAENARETYVTLSNVFNDVPLCTHWWSKQDGFISERVRHVEVPEGTYVPEDVPRQFLDTDWPLRIGELVNEVSRPARDALRLLSIPAYRAMATRIVNQFASIAIRRMLDISGDELVTIILEIRRELRRQNKELVLLIEDFARVRGIDRPLLDALVVTHASQSDLCPLRWALAATTGFYPQIPVNIQARMSFVFNLDWQTTGGASLAGNAPNPVDDMFLARFAARYANALRLPRTELEAWADEDEVGALPPPPNACDRCPLRDGCHADFGEIDGIGLYPFTTQAIANIRRAVASDLTMAFNPRSFIRDVLGMVFKDEAARQPGTHSITGGEFPGPSLVSLLTRQAPRIGVVDDQQMRQTYGPDFDRANVILQWWSSPSGTGVATLAHSIPPGVWDAFGLRPPALQTSNCALVGCNNAAIGEQAYCNEHQPEQVCGANGCTQASRPASAFCDVHGQPSVEDKWVQGLNRWMNKQGVGYDGWFNETRLLVFDALARSIQWDAFGIVRTQVAGSGAHHLFRTEYICVADETARTPGTDSGVRLDLPAIETGDTPAARRQVGLALSALHGIAKGDGLAPPEADVFLPVLIQFLDEWESTVVSRIRAKLADGKWDVAKAATEALGIRALLSGAISDSPQAIDLVKDVMSLQPVTEAIVGRRLGAAFGNAVRQLNTSAESLRNAVNAVSAATKGGDSNYSDISVVSRHLIALRENTWMKSSVGDEPRSPPSSIVAKTASAHKGVPDLEALFEVLKKSVVAWEEKVAPALPRGTPIQSLVREGRSLLNLVQSMGWVAGPNQAPLSSLLTKFEDRLQTPAQAEIDAARKVVDSQGRARNPNVMGQALLLSRTDMTVREEVLHFLATTQGFANQLAYMLDAGPLSGAEAEYESLVRSIDGDLLEAEVACAKILGEPIPRMPTRVQFEDRSTEPLVDKPLGTTHLAGQLKRLRGQLETRRKLTEKQAAFEQLSSRAPVIKEVADILSGAAAVRRSVPFMSDSVPETSLIRDHVVQLRDLRRKFIADFQSIAQPALNDRRRRFWDDFKQDCNNFSQRQRSVWSDHALRESQVVDLRAVKLLAGSELEDRIPEVQKLVSTVMAHQVPTTPELWRAFGQRVTQLQDIASSPISMHGRTADWLAGAVPALGLAALSRVDTALGELIGAMSDPGTVPTPTEPWLVPAIGANLLHKELVTLSDVLEEVNAIEALLAEFPFARLAPESCPTVIRHIEHILDDVRALKATRDVLASTIPNVELFRDLVGGRAAQCARAARASFWASPEAFLRGGEDLPGDQARDAESLTRVAQVIDEHVRNPLKSHWDQYLRGEVRSIPDVVIRVLARNSSLSDQKADEIATLCRSLAARPMPASHDALVQFQSGLAELNGLFRGLSLHDHIPDAVRRFLDGVTSKQGAPVALLTPEVRQWIDSLRLGDSLILRWGD